jgi:aerobic-type carbon monoxide dehydrogenase small subunit (CoxS/CutS family)
MLLFMQIECFSEFYMKGYADMRITQHPILNFDRGKEINFTFNGQPMKGYEGETIAAALHAAGVKVLAKSLEKHRPRGFYCAIGNCASCQMIVDGEPNVRTCITLLREGMTVETQEGKGRIE